VYDALVEQSSSGTLTTNKQPSSGTLTTNKQPSSGTLTHKIGKGRVTVGALNLEVHLVIHKQIRISISFP